jgi:hypothetical protein
VIFSFDCLSLIQRVNSKTPDRSPIGILVADIKRQAADFLQLCSVMFIVLLMVQHTF